VYDYKTKPLPHQAAEFELTRDLKNRALWWEMGCGKTKPMIDTAAWLFLRGEITGVLVLAPKGVAPNWARDELDKHLPDAVRRRTRVLLWDSGKAGTKYYQQEVERALAHDGLLFVCMSYNGIMTEVAPGAEKPMHVRKLRKGRELAKELLTSRRCMMILDESPRIKDPGTKTAKRVQAASPYAAYRRVLSGTPIDNSPFDAYSQIQFLDPFYWQKHGCKGWPAFKAKYGDWVTRLIAPQLCPHPKELRPGCGCRTFPDLVRYKNLDDLGHVLREVGSRLRKDEVLDLPPKMYELRRFDLAPKQQQLYEQIRREFMATLADGSLVTAPLVITQLLRLQQITSGYITNDDGAMVLADDRNPRVDLLADTLADIPHKSIVWAKFKEDFAQIGARLLREEIPYVEFYGATSEAARAEAKLRFQEDPSVRVFLGNPACAGEGLTLTAAQTVLYYNTTYRLAHRLQSEDRAHRIGQEHPVLYIDLVADRTVDEKIIGALREKKDLADLILGDPRGNWI